MLPSPPEPEPYFVAVLDMLGYESHLWDEHHQRRQEGLSRLHEAYTLLLWSKARATVFDEIQMSDDRLVSIHETVDSTIASDTIMLWATEKKVALLVRAVAHLVAQALGFGAPLRGCIAFGDCILDASRDIMIGYPLVEAARGEQSQDWIGVGVLAAAAEALKGHQAVVQYAVPMHDGEHAITHALAWHWAEDSPGDSRVYLARWKKQAPSGARGKYDRALAFIDAVAFPSSVAN
jgi:hypothetical protein